MLSTQAKRPAKAGRSLIPIKSEAYGAVVSATGMF